MGKSAAAIVAVATVLAALTAAVPAGVAANGAWASSFQTTADRVWIGPDYWANPLQDWRVQGGALECLTRGPNRSVFLLTSDVADRRGSVILTLRLSSFEPAPDAAAEAWTGFRLAIRGRFGDYRDDAVYGTGLEAGLRGDGRLFAGSVVASTPSPLGAIRTLRATLVPAGGSSYSLTISALDALDREAGLVSLGGLTATDTRGGLAAVCHQATCGFREWRVAGTRVDAHPERAFGPILFAQYTLSRRTLTLTAQLAPIGAAEPQEARLSLLTSGSPPAAVWREVARAPIDPLARTATFRLEAWDDTRDRMYRVNYTSTGPSGERRHASFDGTIRRDPRDAPSVTVAALAGNHDLGFPHADIVRHVSVFKPDLLAFTGDQVDESAAGFGVQRSPLDTAVLDYLRRWFLFGWAYRDLLRDMPSVILPDDHDVYQRNLWGAGGRDASDIVPALRRADVSEQTQKQDGGGYTMPVEWVNMVQRTQTSHLPPPVDPVPAARGIGVYFTELVWGGISFAILEDRKWKSAPAVALPDAQIVNGWSRNPAFDAARSSDAAGAELLGSRQMRFLERWADARDDDVWMKAVMSQTPLANVATLPAGARADEVPPRLAIPPAGAYAEGERPSQDYGSNGWPQSPRTAALRLMRKARAVHIAGDRCAGSTIQYGIDEFRDGPFAICVPPVADDGPRRWFPPEPGGTHRPGAPRYTGDYLDGFGNRITVLAVSNPQRRGIEPADINDRAPGYGIITFERASRRITFSNWPRWVDPTRKDAAPYPGWPIAIHQDDNAGGARR